jgi:hypothetical protein
MIYYLIQMFAIRDMQSWNNVSSINDRRHTNPFAHTYTHTQNLMMPRRHPLKIGVNVLSDPFVGETHCFTQSEILEWEKRDRTYKIMHWILYIHIYINALR